MFELDDKDLVAIAGSRALRAKWWYVSCGVGVALIIFGYGYVIFSRSPNLDVLWALVGLIVVWAVTTWTAAWIYKRRILKKLREEYSEIIKS